MPNTEDVLRPHCKQSLLIIERYGSVCWDCGKEIPENYPGPEWAFVPHGGGYVWRKKSNNFLDKSQPRANVLKIKNYGNRTK